MVVAGSAVLGDACGFSGGDATTGEGEALSMRRSSLRPRAAPPTAAQVDGGANNAEVRAARRARAAERVREVEEPVGVVRDKVRRLAAAVLAARHFVVYTGAGVSTAARIPDYRGPCGVWTGLARGRPPPRVDLAAATPTLTHMALAALWRAGALRFLVSQNCDGLHLRSGVPRRALAELHGDMFIERCDACDLPHLRRFDTTERTARHRHRTRRLCRACGHELRDTIVHFGERGRARWPLNWRGAVRHARRADVLLVLGSSLKVLRRYPRLWPRRRRPRLFIVNLQWTPKDAVAELKISARCDDVMRLLLRELGVRVPVYNPRRDPLFAHSTALLPRERHTTARRVLSSPEPNTSNEDSSDSEDDTPLRRLADELRSEEKRAFCRFQVQLSTGAAPILLHSKHAPSKPLRPPPPLLPLDCVDRSIGDDQPKPVSKLRQFRRVKPVNLADGVKVNGHLNGHVLSQGLLEPVKSEKVCEIKLEPRDSNIKTEHVPPDVKTEPKFSDVKAELRAPSVRPEQRPEAAAEEKFHRHVKMEESQVEERVMSECVSLARTFIAHALLVCRAQLYPGLHTIIPPAVLAPSVPPASACAWCRDSLGSARCLYYPPAVGTGVPRDDGRWCACCEPGDEPGDCGQDELDEPGGWYGKGHAKIRRRKR